jgi:hypothetical protein
MRGYRGPSEGVGSDMQGESKPDARFQRFEWVLVCTGSQGERGVVLWRDYARYSRYDQGLKKPPRRCSEWVYSVYLPERLRCHSFLESQLEATGEIDAEANHFGRQFEISFDTVNPEDEDAGTIEGCYRLPGRFWEVFVFIKEDDVPELHHRLVTWPSGIAGVQFDVPTGAILNNDHVKRSMADAFGADSWAVVHGPDSLLLKWQCGSRAFAVISLSTRWGASAASGVDSARRTADWGVNVRQVLGVAPVSTPQSGTSGVPTRGIGTRRVLRGPLQWGAALAVLRGRPWGRSDAGHWNEGCEGRTLDLVAATGLRRIECDVNGSKRDRHSQVSMGSRVASSSRSASKTSSFVTPVAARR